MTRQPESAPSTHPIRHVDAVAACVKAWNRTYELASISPDDDSLAPEQNGTNYFARKQAAIAFRDAMPTLYGEENIRGFIGCVAYAVLQDIMQGDEARGLLHAAEVALRAESHRSKSENIRKTSTDSGASLPRRSK